MQGSSKKDAEVKLQNIFNNFQIFKNYPFNAFTLTVHRNIHQIRDANTGKIRVKKYMLSSEEIASFLHFPQSPKNETSLLKVTARKLTLPIGVPSFAYEKIHNEILPTQYPKDTNIL